MNPALGAENVSTQITTYPTCCDVEAKDKAVAIAEALVLHPVAHPYQDARPSSQLCCNGPHKQAMLLHKRIGQVPLASQQALQCKATSDLHEPDARVQTAERLDMEVKYLFPRRYSVSR
jgi:hypothetical protein